MSERITSLIPTSAIYNYDDVLQGNVCIENLKIMGGSGIQSNFNPQTIVRKLKKLDIVIEAVSFNKENFSLIFVIKIKPVINYKTNEIGLFFLVDGQEVLIAYRSDENLLSLDGESRATLELVLPYSRWNQQIDTALATNLPSDIYTETPDNLPCFDFFFSDITVPMQAPDTKPSFAWNEVIKNEINFSHEVSLIAFDRYPKAKNLLFLYKKKNTHDFYFSSFNIGKKEFKTPQLGMTAKKNFGLFLAKEVVLSDRYGIFGKIDGDYIRYYQSHKNGVSCVGLSINPKKKSYSKQQYHVAYVKDDTTLFTLGNNAALAGGSYTGAFRENWDQGNGIVSSSVALEALQCLVPSLIIPDKTKNPIIDVDLDKGEIDVVGGDDDPEILEEVTTEEVTTETKKEIIKETKEEISKEIKKIKETKEEITKEEIKEKVKEVVTEKITEKVTKEIKKEILEVIIEEITEEILENITTEEITEEVIEEVTEETNEWMAEGKIAYSQKAKASKHIIIKNKGKEKKITIKRSPVQTISFNNSPVKKEHYGYFSQLSPQAKPTETLTFENTADFNDLLSVNSLTHMNCKVEKKVYIFSRKMFKEENEAKFFVYDRANKLINTYYLPESVRALVNRSSMADYADVHVTAVDKDIYFTLHKYARSRKKLFTQIIKLTIK